MRTRVWTFALGAALTLALAAPGHSGIVKNGVGGAETVQCRGESVEVNGTSQDLTLLGECPQVEVNGMDNTVRVELAKEIEVNGMNNKVIWGAGISGRPHISTSGMGNSVRQGAVGSGRRTAGSGESVTITGNGDTATIESKRKRGGDSVTITSGAGESVTIDSNRRRGGDSVTIDADGESVTIGDRRAAAPHSAGGAVITVDGNHRTETLDCKGRDASIGGNHNDVTLNGDCGKVEVLGNHNSVQIEGAAEIVAAGNYNAVTWARGAGGRSPRISNVGVRTTVTRASE